MHETGSDDGDVRPGGTGAVEVRGALLRCTLAVGLMFAAAYAPGLPMLVPVVQRALSGGLADVGRGDAGILVACAALAACQLMAVVVAVVGAAVASARLDRRPSSALRLAVTVPALRWASAMILAACVVAAAASAAAEAIGPGGPAQSVPGDTWWSGLLITASMAFLLQGIPEEVIWRGWLIPSLGGGRVAVALSVTVFSLLHLLSDGGQADVVERIVYVAMPFGFSFAAAMARLASGTTWAAVGVHAGFHLANHATALVGAVDSPVLHLFLGLGWAAVGWGIARVFRERMPWARRSSAPAP